MARTLLLTRARPQAEEFAARVRKETGFLTHIAPMQDMRDLPVEIDFTGITALAFTSKNGVSSFARRWQQRDLPAFCVGAVTAKAARQQGFNATAAQGNAVSLAALINNKGERVLHIRGNHTTGNLSAQSIAIYDQIALPLDQPTKDALAEGHIDSVAIFSPRSAQLLAEEWQADWPTGVTFFCISATASAPVQHLGPVQVSDNPSAESLLRLLSADNPPQ